MIGFNRIGNYGRLGNQMFQYAALKGIAEKHKYEFIVPPKSLFGTIDQCVKESNVSIYDCFKLTSLKNVGTVDFSTIEESHFHFDENLFKSCPDNINLMGYFQTEKYFKHIRNEILSDFEFLDQIQDTVNSFLNQYKNVEKVSVHVRRTDYVEKSQFHPLQSLDYYYRAMNSFNDVMFFVFSDDIQWCKEQDIFNAKNIIFPSFNDQYIDFCMMSMCDHNIIANSSYSWWASYLNKNPNKKIIAPSVWFGFHCNLDDLYMDDWMVLQS